MEALTVKAGIFASLFGILGIIGLVVLLASVIWLVIRVANFDSILPALLCVVLSVGLIAGGLVLSPTPDYRPEPLRMPWETLLDWVVTLRDRKAPPEGEDPAASADGEAASPEMEKLTVTYTGASAEGAEPAAFLSGDPAQGGGTVPSAAGEEQNRVLLDEVINGWRVRMTLPQRWKDLCVIENSGTYLAFYQKASYDDYGGLLFDLSAEEGPVDPEIPAVEEIQAKEGTILYARYPTDVQFNYEVQEISEEYSRMQTDIPGILKTIEFERA